MPRTIPIGVFGEDPRVIPHDVKVMEVRLDVRSADNFVVAINWLHTSSFNDFGMNDTPDVFFLEICRMAEVIVICETLIPYFTMAMLERSKSYNTYILLDKGHKPIDKEKRMFLHMLEVARQGVVFAFVGDDDVYDMDQLGREALLAQQTAGPDGIDQVADPDGRAGAAVHDGDQLVPQLVYTPLG